MKLFAEVAEETSALETLGTVAENVGKKGTIAFNLNNLKRDDKLVVVELTNEKGKTQKVYCSAALSAQIRKEKMAKQDLINYVGSLDIAITTNEEGEQRFKIIQRQGAVVSGSITSAAPVVVTNFDEITW